MNSPLDLSRPPSKHLLFLCLVLCGSGIAAAANNSAEVSQAVAHLENERFIEALAAAKNAVRADPSGFEGHYYVAYACMGLKQFAEAEEAAAASLALAPADKKPQVEKLVDVIKGSKGDEGESGQLEREADQASNAGLLAKAANLYNQAYLLSPARGDVGLKAADLFADRLDRIMEAARLWNRIAVAADEKSALVARNRLEQHAPALEKIYKEKFKNASWEDLMLLHEVFPQRMELCVRIASTYALQDNVPKTKEFLTLAIKAGATPDDIFGWVGFKTLTGDHPEGVEFEAFLTDAFGPDLPRRLREQNQKDKERFAALEAKQARERREEWDAQVKARKAAEKAEKVARQLEEFAARVYNIGDLGPAGGIIYYDKGSFADGWRYMEAAPPDWSGAPQDPAQKWGVYLHVIGGNRYEWGVGRINSDGIIQRDGNETAAGLARSYSVEKEGITYNDWFLPSENELKGLFRTLKGRHALKGEYWSSTQNNCRSNSDYAIMVSRFLGVNGYPESKKKPGKIRPVRYVVAPDFASMADESPAAPVIARRTPEPAAPDPQPATPTPQPPETPAATSYRVSGIAAGDVLNIRARPEVASPIVAALPNGTSGIRITGAVTMKGSEDWVPVTVQGRSGWTRPKFLTSGTSIAEEAPDEEEAEAEAPPSRAALGAGSTETYSVTGIKTGDVLNVRERPTAESRLVISLPNGTPGIRITGQVVMNGKDDWVPITVGQSSGWTRPKYLAAAGDDAGTRSAAPVSPAAPASGDPATGAAASGTRMGGILTGLTIAPVSPELRRQYNLPDDVVGGMVVTAVDPGSRAALQGFEQGEVISRLNGIRVNSANEFGTAAATLDRNLPDQMVASTQRGKIQSIRVRPRQ